MLRHSFLRAKGTWDLSCPTWVVSVDSGLPGERGLGRRLSGVEGGALFGLSPFACRLRWAPPGRQRNTQEVRARGPRKRFRCSASALEVLIKSAFAFSVLQLVFLVLGNQLAWQSLNSL